jgi:MFS family permease
MTAPAPRDPRDEDAALRAALIVIAAGVAGALHVGKLPPAIAALQQALGLTLVQAGFLLSLVQFAGMALGVAFGVLADGLGLKRSMVLGLAVLALASAAGGAADGVAALMALRAIEGFGFLLVALPAPGLIRQLALLAGPLAIAAFGWRPWWGLLAAVSALGAVVVARAVPAPPARSAGSAHAATTAWTARLAHTLGARGPWLVALAFAMYSGQWLAVIGFLPTIYTAAGVAAGTTGLLTALAAGVNTLGNVAAGRLLHRGAPQPLLLAAGYVAMALAAALAFAGPADGGAPPWLRYAAVLAFSMLGGMIPATLFSLAVRLAPGEHTLSTTVGWVQQWSSFGQFAGPPLVAWVASRAGGWHWTWAVTGACSLAGLALVAALRREIAAPAGRAR